MVQISDLDKERIYEDSSGFLASMVQEDEGQEFTFANLKK